MLKFIKHHMESITGIEIYPIISFLIFFTFFVLMLVYIIRSSNKKMEILSALPLDNPKEFEHEKAE